MSDGPLRVALRLADPALADRVAAALADAPGVSLVTEGADVLVVPAGAAAAGEPGLTPREREVLALMSDGASNKAIARALGISVHTVKFHVAQLLDKLDATGRTDAVTEAARRGVIHL